MHGPDNTPTDPSPPMPEAITIRPAPQTIPELFERQCQRDQENEAKLDARFSALEGKAAERHTLVIEKFRVHEVRLNGHDSDVAQLRAANKAPFPTLPLWALVGSILLGEAGLAWLVWHAAAVGR